MSITNHGRRAAQPRADQLRRGRARAAATPTSRIPAFSNLFVETTALPERDALICARRPRSGGDRAYLRARAERPRPDRRGDRVRDRPRALRRPRPHAGQSAGAGERRAAVEHDRAGARSDRQPAPVDPAAAGRHRAARVHHRLRRERGGRAPARSRSTTTGARSRAPSRWPARTARSSCATSA